MTKEIRLNAFSMNAVGHQSPGLWRHPRDRSAEFNRLGFWTDLAKTLEAGLFDGLFLADVLGVYDVYGGSPDAALRNGTQVPGNDPSVLVSAMALRPQLELAAWLRTRTAATIFFDPQEDYVAGHEAALTDAVRACDVFLPSEIEATALAGTADLEVAAAAFLDLGLRAVVIKRAEAGCLVATRERPVPVVVPTDVVAPVDSTGAGDAFCGAFAVEYLRGGDAHAAARIGAATARIAVGGPGVSALLAAVETNSGVPR